MNMSSDFQVWENSKKKTSKIDSRGQALKLKTPCYSNWKTWNLESRQRDSQWKPPSNRTMIMCHMNFLQWLVDQLHPLSIISQIPVKLHSTNYLISYQYVSWLIRRVDKTIVLRSVASWIWSHMEFLLSCSHIFEYTFLLVFSNIYFGMGHEIVMKRKRS